MAGMCRMGIGRYRVPGMCRGWRCVPPAMTTAVIVRHVGHAQQRAAVQCRHPRGQAGAGGQGAAGKAGAAHVLGKHGEGVLPGRLDDHIKGLGGGNAQLVHADRVHVLAIGGDHGQLQPGDADVEMGHRRAVDQAQQHALTGAEQPGPVRARGVAVEQVGVGIGVDVGKVGRRHPHPRPLRALGQGRAQAIAAGIAYQLAQRLLVGVVVHGHLLHPPVQRGPIQVGPVREQQHVFAVEAVGRWCDRVDHDRPVQPGLFLEQRMAVVPVGAVLPELEAVVVGLARGDAVKAQPRHAVHVGRQQQAVPVDRADVIAQRVVHVQVDGLALAPAQDRRRQRLVHGDRGACLAGEVHRQLADVQVLGGTAQFGYREGDLTGLGGGQAPQARAGDQAGKAQALDETAAGHDAARVVQGVIRHGVHSNAGLQAPRADSKRKDQACRHATAGQTVKAMGGRTGSASRGGAL